MDIHGAIDDGRRISAEHRSSRLVSLSALIVDIQEFGERGVQLRDPRDKLGFKLASTTAWIQTKFTLGSPAVVLVVKLLLYPTCFPGVSQVKKTSRPGYESGSDRLCVIAGVVWFPITVVLKYAVALGLFCGKVASGIPRVQTKRKYGQ